MWTAVLLAGIGCYLLKLAGLSLPERVLAHPTVERVADLIPVALLAALVAVQVWADGSRLVLDARVARPRPSRSSRCCCARRSWSWWWGRQSWRPWHASCDAPTAAFGACPRRPQGPRVTPSPGSPEVEEVLEADGETRPRPDRPQRRRARRG